MSEVYYHDQLTGGALARAIHKSFNFSADNTYRGKQQIEVRRDDNQFSVAVRTDKQTREFILEFGGKTQFVQTWHDGNECNLYELGSKITSIVYPDGGVAEQQDAVEMAFECKTPSFEWLRGSRAEDVRRIHRYMLEDVMPQLREYLVDPEAKPVDVESAVQKYRSEDLGYGSELAAFMAKRKSSPGPCGPA